MSLKLPRWKSNPPEIGNALNQLAEHLEVVFNRRLDADHNFLVEHSDSDIRLRLNLDPNSETDELRPLTLLEANTNDGPRIRVVKGGVQAEFTGDGGDSGNTHPGLFWYADAAMDAQEDGSDEHPYWYTDDSLADGDSIYLDISLSTDGIFWRIESVALANASEIPANTEFNIFQLLGVISVGDDNKAKVIRPQEFFGNLGWQRTWISSDSYADRFWTIRQ